MNEIVETPPIPKKRGNIDATKKALMFDEITEIIESGDIIRWTDAKLAKKYGTTRQTIAKMQKEIYSKIPLEDVSQIQIKLENTYNLIFREVKDSLDSVKTDFDKRKTMELLLLAMDKYQDFLERWERKTKVAEKVQVDNKITVEVVTTHLPPVEKTPLIEVQEIGLVANPPNPHATFEEVKREGEEIVIDVVEKLE